MIKLKKNISQHLKQFYFSCLKSTIYYFHHWWLKVYDSFFFLNQEVHIYNIALMIAMYWWRLMMYFEMSTISYEIVRMEKQTKTSGIFCLWYFKVLFTRNCCVKKHYDSIVITAYSTSLAPNKNLWTFNFFQKGQQKLLKNYDALFTGKKWKIKKMYRHKIP